MSVRRQHERAEPRRQRAGAAYCRLCGSQWWLQRGARDGRTAVHAARAAVATQPAQPAGGAAAAPDDAPGEPRRCTVQPARSEPWFVCRGAGACLTSHRFSPHASHRNVPLSTRPLQVAAGVIFALLVATMIALLVATGIRCAILAGCRSKPSVAAPARPNTRAGEPSCCRAVNIDPYTAPQVPQGGRRGLPDPQGAGAARLGRPDAVAAQEAGLPRGLWLLRRL